MRCCVPNCCNNNKGSADNGISFHLFPKDPSQRSAWTSSLNITKWEPSHNSAVCSDHFSSNQLFVSKSGDVKVAADAVPVIEDDSELDSLAIYRVCRICLSMDTKTYELKDFKNVYELLTGFHVPDSMFLPQVACYECCQRLKNAATLREKAIKSDRLLNIVLKQKGCLTFRSVKEINRHKNNLNSSLIQKIYENDDWNLLIKDDEIVKVELNNDIYNGNETYTENNDTYPENNDTFDNDTEFDVYNDDYTKLNILEVDIKNETKNEIFINEYGSDFESDDDKKLSEICQVKVKSKVKKKKEKLEKKVKIAKKKIDEHDSVSAADKYKTSNVKRRKINNDIEESLFTVTHLTYEEQVKEVEMRQESNSFKTAPYQCTVCYRGFPARERFDAHVVRHSEQSGAFECFICKTRLKTVRALRKHLTSQHTEKFSCKGCPFVTKNRGVARAHAKWHAGTKYQCQQCGAEFDKITTYMGHIRIKHVSDFICQLCGYTFISEKGIEVHKKKKHRLESYSVPDDGPYCEVCDVRFISEEAHDRHLKLSSKHTREDDPERIRNDSQSINTVRKMRAYRKIERRPVIYRSNEVTKNSGGPVTCEQCGLQLRDLRLYAQHFRRVHPDKNRTKYPAMKTPAMCELCGRIFQSMALLQDHMWVHTGEKRFKCSRCPKSFTQKTNLVCHERVHSASRPTYECPLCGKHFAFYNNRRRHMFIHTGLKPHKCDTCGKCFTTAGEQRAHVDHVHMKKPWPKRSRRRDDFHAKDDE